MSQIKLYLMKLIFFVFALTPLTVFAEQISYIENPTFIKFYPRHIENKSRESCSKYIDTELETKVKEASKKHSETNKRVMKAFYEKIKSTGIKRDHSEAYKDPQLVASQRKLDALREKLIPIKTKRRECYEKAMYSIKSKLNLYESPSEDSKQVGYIEISVGKKGSLHYKFFKEGSIKPVDFKLDQFNEDWTYGVLYHTLLAQEGDWLKFPKDPFENPVWFNLKKDMQIEPEIYDLSKMHILSHSKWGSFVVLEVKDGIIHARNEVSEDMSCGEYTEKQIAAAIKKATRFKLKAKDFFDQNEHIRITMKFQKGC